MTIHLHGIIWIPIRTFLLSFCLLYHFLYCMLKWYQYETRRVVCCNQLRVMPLFCLLKKIYLYIFSLGQNFAVNKPNTISLALDFVTRILFVVINTWVQKSSWIKLRWYILPPKIRKLNPQQICLLLYELSNVFCILELFVDPTFTLLMYTKCSTCVSLIYDILACPKCKTG